MTYKDRRVPTSNENMNAIAISETNQIIDSFYNKKLKYDY